MQPLGAPSSNAASEGVAGEGHDHKQREAHMSLPRAKHARAPYVDFLKPIIADGDTGFGAATTTVK